MKSIVKIPVISLLIILFVACNKNDIPISSLAVTTNPATNVLFTSALSGGTATDDGNVQIVDRGVCWDTLTGPTTDKKRTADGAGPGSFESTISGLSPGTHYFVRAFATNNQGTVYGNEISFTTHIPGVIFNPNVTYGAITDIEGKTYKTVVIGTQVWMAQNLRTTKFNDGTSIPLVTGDGEWSNLVTPGYCWFNNNDSIFENIYGAYYNWFAVTSGNLCPVGWHVPSDTEWQTLIDYLGGSKIAGSKLKETGTNNWVNTNKDATNQSGFTALPAGLRGALDGTFGGQGDYGGWWSTTEFSSSPLGAVWIRWVHADTTVAARNEIFKKDGFTVRCLEN